jgi:hypothetical protein
MSRWDVYGKKDSQPQADGDSRFTGLDMVRERSLLAPETLARAENKRLRNGPAETRPGTALPSDFNPGFGNQLIGSGIYSNPNGDEVLMVAPKNSDHVWALQSNKDPRKILIDPTDITVSTGAGAVTFVQAFEKVFLLRSPLAGPSAVLVWDGDNTHKFVPITLSSIGKTLIPATSSGIPFANRLLLFYPYFTALPWRDQFIMTDPLDYTSYDNFLGVFRVNAGASEILTTLFPYDQARLLVFMRHSIHMVSDFTVDPFQTTQQVLSTRVGNEGIHTVAQLGGDVVFLSKPGGIYRVTQSASTQIAADPIPISEPIQPVIDRVAWPRAIFFASAAVLKHYLFFALPLDNPLSNKASDAIVVYNAYTGQWESAPDWWDDADFAINRLHVTNFNDQARLFGVDYAHSRVYLLYEGLEDEISVSNSVPVRDVIETRGYVCGDPGGFKNFLRTTIGLRTYDPHAQITAITDGFNEEKEIADITKDPLQSYLHGRAHFDPLSDDPTAPYREDYGEAQSETVVEDFEGLPDGPITFLPATPMLFTGNKQQSLERYQIRDTGRWVSLRIANIRGQCDVLGVQVEGVPTEEGVKLLV